MGYLVRRALHGLFLLVGVSLLVFGLVAMAPGDFYSELRLSPTVSPKTIDQLRIEYGLDQPLHQRYLHWVAGMVRGDWGESLTYHVPVWPLLRDRARNTLLLTIIATLLAWIFALALGIWAVGSGQQVFNTLVHGVAAALVSVPDLLICLVLLVWALRTRALPLGGMASVDAATLGRLARWRDTFVHMFLPVSALTLSALPVLLRHVQSSLLSAMTAPSVTTARAYGIRGRRILLRHVLPLAANPLITLLGLSIAGLLSGSLVVEVIMGWPGLGPLLLESILARDLYVVIGAVMLSTLFLVAGNFLADALLFTIDPRTREEQA